MRAWELAQSEVHCWSFRPARFVAGELAGLLSLDERERARRFVFDRDRTEYIVCRGLLRHLLSFYTGIDASDIQFEYSPRGKPALARKLERQIQFNVAHSHGAGLIGITRVAPIGVDVERRRQFADVSALVPTCFAPEEQAELALLPEWIQAQAFYAGWTRKEAFIKATGEGLSRPLHSFAVTIAPSARPKLVRCDLASAEAWTIADAGSDCDFAAAIAVPASEVRVTRRNLDHQVCGLPRTWQVHDAHDSLHVPGVVERTRENGDTAAKEVL